jgi:hypothetical protein
VIGTLRAAVAAVAVVIATPAFSGCTEDKHNSPAVPSAPGSSQSATASAPVTSESGVSNGQT